MELMWFMSDLCPEYYLTKRRMSNIKRPVYQFWCCRLTLFCQLFFIENLDLPCLPCHLQISNFSRKPENRGGLSQKNVDLGIMKGFYQTRHTWKKKTILKIIDFPFLLASFSNKLPALIYTPQRNKQSETHKWENYIWMSS